MGVQNARFIYNNLADASTITASSSGAATPVTNLILDSKSRVWRTMPTTASSTTVRAVLVIDLGSNKQVGGVALAFTNLQSSSATIQVQGYTSAPSLTASADSPSVSGTALYSQTIACCPWQQAVLQGTASTYGYGLGTHARAWLNATNQAISVRYLSITITDTYTTSAANRFIEVSRLVVGEYWSPKYNISYGASSNIEDSSDHERTQAGDLVTKIGPKFKKLEIPLEYIASQDLQQLKRIRSQGKHKSIWVSLFPDNSDSWDREQEFQGLMKFTEVPGLENFNLDYYQSSWSLEEI